MTLPEVLRLDLPVLGDASGDGIFPASRPAGRVGAFALHRAGDWLLGQANLDVAGDIETATRTLYTDLLRAAQGWHLCRVWNCVPQINAHDAAGLEHYRAFCRGRAAAFDTSFGAGTHARLSAASAVGTRLDTLGISFAATVAAPRHVENPAQVPAYLYPSEHGPRAPSFARATVAADGRAVFISGTAAIKGHASIAPGETLPQLDCTLDNLAALSRAIGLGDTLGAGAGFARHFKIYLRHAEDFSAAAARLDDVLLRRGDSVTWLHADICRAELTIEIEATLMRV